MAGLFEKFKHKPAPTPQFRGMQQKWQDGDVFYKVDSSLLNAEGLCETIASAILAKSNIADYCIYTPQLLITNDMQIPGCASHNFLPDDCKLLTALDILRQLNHPLYHKNLQFEPNKIQLMAEFASVINQLPGIFNYEQHLAALFRFDAIIHNVDRNLTNFGLFQNEETKRFRIATVFDNGQSFALLYNNQWNYMPTMDEVFSYGNGRPFFADLNRQATEMENIAGGVQFYTSFSHKDLDTILEQCSSIYPPLLINRARLAVEYTMEKNIDFFRGEEVDNRLEKIASYIDIGLPNGWIIEKLDDRVRVKSEEWMGEWVDVFPSCHTEYFVSNERIGIAEMVDNYPEMIEIARHINMSIDSIPMKDFPIPPECREHFFIQNEER